MMQHPEVATCNGGSSELTKPNTVSSRHLTEINGMYQIESWVFFFISFDLKKIFFFWCRLCCRKKKAGRDHEIFPPVIKRGGTNRGARSIRSSASSLRESSTNEALADS